ncbi:MAG: ATP-binding protein [Actinobacteria bacterium]|jgi:predicted AAA+ superfamily ATPase|nr:MAG: ATP-binding protein [Actinomycetota bacterium]
MYIQRELGETIEKALRDMPVVVVTGMRQVGKSTMLLSDPRLSGRHYLNLDDYAVMRSLQENPDAVLGGLEEVTIDEAQRVGGLFMAIKRAVDDDRKPGRFLLSGSANPALLKGVSESLAGRAIYFGLPPMSRREIHQETRMAPFLIDFLRGPGLPKRKSVSKLEDGEVLTGGLPPVALGEVSEPKTWFTGYEQTYLERDLRDIAAVENILGFRDLLKLAALRTAQILNIASLARDASLDAKTAARYLGWMEATYIIRRVQPFLRNKASRIKKSPKLYITDSGLACHLTDCGDLSDDPLRGALYETYVFQNIASVVENHIPPGRIYYWQTQAGREVDFVIEIGRDIVAVEVKSGENWTKRDLKGLSDFLSATPRCKAAVIAYNGKEAIKLGDKMWAIPLGTLIS